MEIKLTSEQIKVLNNKNKGSCLIKGVAGSGKTTIALYKIINTLKEIENTNETILLLTYNKTLIAYMKSLCKQNHINLNEKQLKIKTTDSFINGYIYNENLKIADDNDKRNILYWAIQKIQKNYGKNTIARVENIDFLLEEFSWMKSCRYITKEEYLMVDRLGRMEKGNTPMRLQKQGKNRQIIYELLFLYENKMLEQKMTDFYTNALKVLNRMEKKQLYWKKYSYIVVDECQDLTRVQLEIIKKLYNDKEGSCIWFLTDIAQSIYMHSWLSKHSFKSIGFNMAGKSNILSKNYRTTKQIAMAAYSLLGKDLVLNKSDNFVEPVLVERNGAKPQYHSFERLEQELNFLVKEIKKLLLNGTFDLHDIAIVAKTWNYLEDIKPHLLNHGLDAHLLKNQKSEAYYEEEKIHLLTLHSSKGLEFPVVFIVGINENILPFSDDKEEEERKVLYVGMTRAKELLYMSSSAKASRFIAEIEPKYFANISQIGKYYEIPIERYFNTDSLQNNPEEKVRQWFVEQLFIHYGYPQELIQLEYPIQYGSRQFFEDIAVFRNYEQMDRPFIFVEIKKKGLKLDTAYKQMESYLLPNTIPEYIVVTNGDEIITQKVSISGKDENFKLKFTPVTDIPYYREADTLSYCYIDLYHNKKFSYKQDCEKNEIFYICEKNGERMVDSHTIQLMGEVAAGVLKHANIMEIEKFQFPELFVSQSDLLYALRVKGDSMIDFGIENEDIVIVKTQNYANNGDIIIGGNKVENQLTLKRFEDTTSHIILHPGNSKYEKIYIAKNDFFMNGIIVGIVKSI